MTFGLRGDGRIAGGGCKTRGDGGDAAQDKESAILQVAALALPLRTDGGLLRRIRERRAEATGRGAVARWMVQQALAAYDTREAESGAHAD